MRLNRILTLTASTLTVLGLAALPIEAEVGEKQSGRTLVAQMVEDPEGAIDLDDATNETDAHEGIGEEPGVDSDYEPDYSGTRDSVPEDIPGVDEESAIDLDDANNETDAQEGIGEEPQFNYDESDIDSTDTDDANVFEPSDSDMTAPEGDNIDEESAIDLEDATDETDAHEGIGEEPTVVE